MAAVKITDRIQYVGMLNPSMRTFDIVMHTEYGTSYNAYLLQGGNKTALIEACHLNYADRFLENIEQVCDPAQIDYIVLNHNEPDHTGCVIKLLDRMPNATIVVSQAGSLYLKNIVNRPDLRVQVAKDGDLIDLGGCTMRFISAPFLHWPDSMFTWVEEEKTLFCCDFLGAHFCEPYTFDHSILHPSKYEDALSYYYHAIFGPFPSYVRAGLSKLEGLDIERACNSHGPVLTRGCRLEYALDQYRQWSQPHQNARLTVPVFYATAYGNTKLIAQAIRAGILAERPEADVPLCSLIHESMEQLGIRLGGCDAFAIGCSTINADAPAPAWELLSHVDAIGSRKKPALVFGSYGWSGEAVPNLSARLAGLKMHVFGDGLKICFTPTPEDLQRAEETGRAFARTLPG